MFLQNPQTSIGASEVSEASASLESVVCETNAVQRQQEVTHAVVPPPMRLHVAMQADTLPSSCTHSNRAGITGVDLSAHLKAHLGAVGRAGSSSGISDDHSSCQVASSSGRSSEGEDYSWADMPFCIRNAVLLSVIPSYCAPPQLSRSFHTVCMVPAAT